LQNYSEQQEKVRTIHVAQNSAFTDATDIKTTRKTA